jgi:hypothetical protein
MPISGKPEIGGRIRSQGRSSDCHRSKADDVPVAMFTLKNRTISPVAGLFVGKVRALAVRA